MKARISGNRLQIASSGAEDAAAQALSSLNSSHCPSSCHHLYTSPSVTPSWRWNRMKFDELTRQRCNRPVCRPISDAFALGGLGGVWSLLVSFGLLRTLLVSTLSFFWRRRDWVGRRLGVGLLGCRWVALWWVGVVSGVVYHGFGEFRGQFERNVCSSILESEWAGTRPAPTVVTADGFAARRGWATGGTDRTPATRRQRGMV